MKDMTQDYSKSVNDFNHGLFLLSLRSQPCLSLPAQVTTRLPHPGSSLEFELEGLQLALHCKIVSGNRMRYSLDEVDPFRSCCRGRMEGARRPPVYRQPARR